MINYQDQITQKITLENELEQLEPLTGKKVFIFPFRIISGITNFTEKGEKNFRYNPDDFTSFFKVINGKEAVIAVWNRSTKCYADELSKKSPINGLAAEFKVGEYFEGYVESDDSSLNISNLQGYDEYISMKTTKRITISFDKNYNKKYELESNNITKNFNLCWDVENKQLTDLYIIPELFANQWLVIDNVAKFYRTDGTLERTTITFRTLNDDIAATAGVKNSLIQPSAGGEGYAWPLITNKNGNKKITLDNIRLIDTPVTSFQIRQEGIAGFNTMMAFGRQVYSSDLNVKIENGVYKKRIRIPRLLLPSRTLAPINDTLNFQPSNIDNYYVTLHGKCLFKEIYSKWQDSISINYEPLSTPNFEGAIQLAGNNNEYMEDIKGTNPLSGDKYIYSFKDNEKIIITNKDVSFPTQATPACESTITFKGGEKYSYADIMCHNYFITSPVTRLPQGSNSTIVWSLNKLPLIGKGIAFITSGVNYGFQTTKTKIPTPDIPLFVPCDICDMQLKGTGGSAFTWTLPFEMFRFSGTDQMSAMTGIGNFNSTVRVKLTDQYLDNGKACNTLYLGQAKDENGNPILEQKWNSNCRPLQKEFGNNSDGDNIIGYIIDGAMTASIFSGDHNITFFTGSEYNGNEEQVANFKLQTKSFNTKSIREWKNLLVLSYWKDGFNTDGDLSWPEEVLMPLANQDILSDVTCDITTLMNIENNLNFYNYHWGSNHGLTQERLNPWLHKGFYQADNFSAVATDWNQKQWFSTYWSSGFGNFSGWNPYGCFYDKTDKNTYHSYIDLLTCLNANVNVMQQVTTYEQLAKQFSKVRFIFKMDRSYIGSYVSSGNAVGSDQLVYELTTKEILDFVKNGKTKTWQFAENYTSYVSCYQQRVGWMLMAFVVPEKYAFASTKVWGLKNFWFDRQKNMFAFNAYFWMYWTLNNISDALIATNKLGGEFDSRAICSKIIFIK